MSGDLGTPFAVLLVCTGNICRSTLAERLGRAYLDETLGEDSGLIRLTSAGTRAVVGSAMHPDSALVLAGFGGDAAGFTARQLAASMVNDADLVLTMTRNHRRVVLERAPRALSRVFTLLEAADLASASDSSPRDNAEPSSAREVVKQWAARRSRRPGSAADDVPDPIRGPLMAHQAAGDLIAPALLTVLARLVAAQAPDREDLRGAGPPASASATAVERR